MNNLSKRSSNIRASILKAAHTTPGRGAHIGGALSCVDFLVCATDYFRLRPEIDKKSCRIVLSKGHACLALYALLLEQNILSDEEFNSFELNGSKFAGHPIIQRDKEIYFSTGSLGLGLACSIGQAIHLHKEYGEQSPKVCVVVGDGEFSEGVIFESLRIISDLCISNILIFIDANGLQQTGSVFPSQSSSSIFSICSSIGLNTYMVDGHNHSEITECISSSSKIKKPAVMVGNTNKGAGISSIVNSNEWHHAKLTERDYANFIEELS